MAGAGWSVAPSMKPTVSDSVRLEIGRDDNPIQVDPGRHMYILMYVV